MSKGVAVGFPCLRQRQTGGKMRAPQLGGEAQIDGQDHAKDFGRARPVCGGRSIVPLRLWLRRGGVVGGRRSKLRRRRGVQREFDAARGIGVDGALHVDTADID